jgi:catechol 2,3-dioxygenase-like lactoylglutathione lyase family enzyme
MIDHVSVPVRDLEAATRFYDAVLGSIGYARLITRPEAVGFGKKYPEFWLNRRPQMNTPDAGMHVCLRATSAVAVDAFHAAALRAGGASDGTPGLRPQYSPRYYAAFIRDADGNRIEAVTFLATED